MVCALKHKKVGETNGTKSPNVSSNHKSKRVTDRERSQEAHKVLRFGIWDNVEGMGPVSWLFFKILSKKERKMSQKPAIQKH